MPSFTYKRGLLVPEQCVQLSYYQALCYIRGTLAEKFQGFPNKGCVIGGKVVHEVLGLPLLVGWYVPLYKQICKANPLAAVDGSLAQAYETWNVEEEARLCVDISQSQYRKDLPPITIRPKTTSVLRVISGMTNEIRATSLQQMSSALREEGVHLDLEPLVKQLRRDLYTKTK